MIRVPKESAYMEWAKTRSMARFNLATSGLTSASTAEFPLHDAGMEITGPGGYGYALLQERLALHTNAPVDCIVAATGTSMANYLAMSVVLDPGDEVLIERPAYGLFNDIAGYLGARIAYFDRSFDAEFVLDLEALANAITASTRLIVISNLHNPSGALIPPETLIKAGELAQRAGVYVLVDEAYIEMVFDRQPPLAFNIGQSAFGSANPFITTNSLTKTYGLSGLRCGWILAAPELARRMWRLNDLFGVNAPHIAEQMSVVAFDRLETLRSRTRNLLTVNRELLNKFLDEHPHLQCYRPAAGTVVFPKVPNGNPDALFALLREKYETTVVPGHFFGWPQHFRIGIGGETQILEAGLERITAALAES